MATHSSILAWRIPWTEEPDGLLSKGSQRIRCNWAYIQLLHVLGNQNLCVGHFLAIFALFQGSGSRLAVSLRHACIKPLVFLECHFSTPSVSLLLFPPWALFPRLGAIKHNSTFDHLQDLSSLTRDQTWILAIKAVSPNSPLDRQGTPKNSLKEEKRLVGGRYDLVPRRVFSC